MRKFVSGKFPLHLFIVLALIFLTAVNAHSGNMTPELQISVQTLADQEVPIIITFPDRINPGSFTDNDRRLKRSKIITALKEKAGIVQQPLKAFLLSKKIVRLKSLWINNAIAVTVPANMVGTISNFPGVGSVSLDYSIQVSAVAYGTISQPQWNIATIKAPALWNVGFTGTGTVVANMDTGVDLNHPDLKDRWRGGANGWYDPNGEHAGPYDADGHGTQTMGIMVGGNAGGTSIGVAPGAEWIAVKIYNDAGVTNPSVIHQGFQWLLDPDNDADTDDAPDIVNNSWGLEVVNSCSTEFQPDIRALKASGIEVVFAAGNSGPNHSTSTSPANNGGSFSAGASDETNSVAYFSSRGPSACNGSIFPKVTAPGVNVRTSDITFEGVFPDSYAYVSGTSFSVPHVAGTMALLLSAFPDLQIQDLELALKASALDLGRAGPDYDYGFGLIKVASAYRYVFTLLNGAVPRIAAVSSPYFGRAELNTIVTRAFVIANRGTANLVISAVALTGDHDFTMLKNTCTGILKSLGTCKVNISFAPSSVGLKKTSITVSSNDPKNATLTGELTGRGYSPL